MNVFRSIKLNEKLMLQKTSSEDTVYEKFRTN